MSTITTKNTGPSVGNGEEDPVTNHAAAGVNRNSDIDESQASPVEKNRKIHPLAKFFKAVRANATRNIAVSVDKKLQQPQDTRKRKAEEMDAARPDPNSEQRQQLVAPPPEAFHFDKRPRSISNDTPSAAMESTVSRKGSTNDGLGDHEVIDLCDSDAEQESPPPNSVKDTLSDRVKKNLERSAMALSSQKSEKGCIKMMSSPLSRNSLAEMFASDFDRERNQGPLQEDERKEVQDNETGGAMAQVISVEQDIPKDIPPLRAAVAPKETVFEYVPLPKSPGRFLLSTCKENLGHAVKSAQRFCRENKPATVTIQVGKKATARPNAIVHIGEQSDRALDNPTLEQNNKEAAGKDGKDMPPDETEVAAQEKDTKLTEKGNQSGFWWGGGVRFVQTSVTNEESGCGHENSNVQQGATDVAATQISANATTEDTPSPMFASELENGNNVRADMDSSTAAEETPGDVPVQKISAPAPGSEYEENVNVSATTELLPERNAKLPQDEVQDAESQHDAGMIEEPVEAETQNIKGSERSNEIESADSKIEKEEKATQSEPYFGNVNDSIVNNGECSGHLLVVAVDEEEGEKSNISAIHLLPLAIPVVLVAGCLRLLLSASTSDAMMVGCSRLTVQLSLLGGLSAFVMQIAKRQPAVIFGAILVMVTMSASEVLSRVKFTYEGQFLHVFGAMSLSVLWTTAFTFCFLWKPRQRWHPTHTLPIVCLLLGSCIIGLHASLDTLAVSLIDKQGEIQLLQGFGASKYETTQQAFSLAIAKGLSSILGMMRVFGVLGMWPLMSFGGVTAKQAAHFQLVVVIMATLCSVSASLFSCVAKIESSFGPREIFVSHVFPHGKKKGVISISLWLWSVLSGSTKEPREFAPHNFRQSENDEIRGTKMELMGPSLSFIRLEHFSDEAPILFEATGFALEGWIEDMYDDTALAQQTLTIRLGDVLELQGRDRLIKTECFRAFAGLHSNFRGNMTLAGASWNTTRSKDVAEWRRSVIFLPENRPRIGGNPLQFLKRVAGFRSWSRNSHSNEEDRARRLIHDVSDYLLHWGMSLESLNREWGTLPDEEAYMVLMSTALASRPKMLLLEPPASLSTDAKAAIDRSVWAYADEQRGSVLLISTDSSDDGEA